MKHFMPKIGAAPEFQVAAYELHDRNCHHVKQLTFYNSANILSFDIKQSGVKKKTNSVALSPQANYTD
jgi:hypothetical protein